MIVILQNLLYKHELNMSRHIFHMTVTLFDLSYRQVAPTKASFKEVGVGEVDWVKGPNIHKPRFVASGNPSYPTFPTRKILNCTIPPGRKPGPWITTGLKPSNTPCRSPAALPQRMFAVKLCKHTRKLNKCIYELCISYLH